MKSVTKLKDEARKHEQREDWDKAIQVYQSVLRAIDDESVGESELPLFNRIGDLYVRLGQPADAVKYYEKAADRYAEAGLYNNAIALCNKALRYQPARLPLFRKLGQYCAHQGFLTDARRWYLEFADRMFKLGDLDEAFGALDDFASISDDPEARLVLGRKLAAHDRADEALREFRRAHAVLRRTGQEEAAANVRVELQELIPDAPDLTFDADAPEDRGPGLQDLEGPDSLPELRDADELPSITDAPVGVGDARADEGIAPVEDEEPAGRIEGFQDTRLDSPDGTEVAASTLAGLDTGRDDTLDRMRSEADGPDDEPGVGEDGQVTGLPLLGDTSESDPAPAVHPAPPASAGSAPEKSFATSTAIADDEFIDLAALLTPEERVETTRFFIKEREPTGDEEHDFAELLNQFRAKLAEHVPENDAGSHYDLGLAFKDMGLVDDAISEYQVALRAGQDRLKVFEELGQCFILKQQYNIAVKVLSRALQFDRRDELELIGVYYFLGRAYEELGSLDEARDAYERVMGLDIRFEDVQERVARL